MVKRERERERERERALCCYSYGIYTLELQLQMVLTFNCCSWASIVLGPIVGHGYLLIHINLPTLFILNELHNYKTFYILFIN